MPKRLAHFGFVLVLGAIAITVRTFKPMDGWVDLLAVSDLKKGKGGQGYQRWIERPGAFPLLLTLRKHHGGNRNRGWSLEVSIPADQTRPSKDRHWSWPWSKHPESNSKALATFHALECIDDFQFGQTVPQFWYRLTGGRFELLARQRDNPWNEDFSYQEGYYLWTPGEPWRKSTAWGTPGEVATCFHAISR